MSAGSTAQAISKHRPAPVETFRAPLFERILQAEETEARQVVLDLGAPCQNLLERLAAIRPTRVEIADLVASGGLDELCRLEKSEHEEPLDLRRFLPRPNDEPLNLILCWDLPNYIGLKTFTELCKLLGRRAAPGCQLHMLITYAKRDMPARPGHFATRSDSQLVQMLEDDSRVAAPRYSPEALNEAVGGFRYERGVLLTNGNQEFIYAWPR